MNIPAIDQVVEEMWHRLHPNEMGYFNFALALSINIRAEQYFFDVTRRKTVPERCDLDEIWEDFRNNGYNDIPYDPSYPECVTSENPSNQPPQMESNKTSSHAMRYQVQGTEFYCQFCFKNTNEASVYQGHRCKDERGFVCCPVLQTLVCPYCKATGKRAHTIKYCPYKPNNCPPTDSETVEQRKHEESYKPPATPEAYCKYCHIFGHTCRDEFGVVQCPILQTVVCNYCKATGKMAHSMRDCPIKLQHDKYSRKDWP
ncbi:AGAP006098-PA-like protein [Anopheles sinensis]|uniref:AGAP006098-PA-like protein n=1 Tax=Anopheles sinensis TaxID=74873 RepID=A0A084VIZ7_ANOSI|nr:AGAP006098-PA-like protein [Anopheles sinensis]